MTDSKQYTSSAVDLELDLKLKDNSTLFNLRDFQQDWLLRKFMNESMRDLEQTTDLAKRFVTGTKRPPLPESWATQDVEYDDHQLVLKGHQVMQAWEHPIMKMMAEVAAGTHGDVLEIGFGMGISATYMLEHGVRSYTVVEPNEAVIQYFQQWREKYSSTPIRLIQGNWQQVTAQFGEYDGLLFDPYFVSEPDSVEVESTTGVGSFLPLVIPHLREGAMVTYFSREIDSLSRAHQRMLFRYFRSVELRLVRDLVPPPDCNYWWADSMVVVRAIR